MTTAAHGQSAALRALLLACQHQALVGRCEAEYVPCGGTPRCPSCKALYTDTLDAQCDAITKAAKQLEESRCQFGVVVVNVANIFPHDAVFDLTMKTAGPSPAC